MTYFEKLKDPRWQKKRLEKLESASFECENCGDDKEELSVHHRHYKKSADPWEYDIDELVVFCKTCHTKWHEAKNELNEVIGRIGTSDDIRRVIGYALALGVDAFPKELKTYQHIVGYADAFRTNTDVISYCIKSAEKQGGCPVDLPFVFTRQMVHS